MARLDFKLSEQNKNMISQAATAEGVTMSDFVISAALKKANATQESHVATRIMQADLGAITRALSEPNISPRFLQKMKELKQSGATFEL